MPVEEKSSFPYLKQLAHWFVGEKIGEDAGIRKLVTRIRYKDARGMQANNATRLQVNEGTAPSSATSADISLNLPDAGL